MKTKNTGTVLFIILALTMAFSSCTDLMDADDYTVDPLRIPEYFTIFTQPQKTVYAQGESYDWTGLTIRETYFNGSSGMYYYSYGDDKYEITGFNSNSVGLQTIKVSRSGISQSFTITINQSIDQNKTLLYLSIYSPPYKTTYEMGESYDWTGLAIIEYYSDTSFGISYATYLYEISGFDSSSAGQKTITVGRYDSYGIFQTTSFYITVNASSSGDLIYLTIASEPRKTTYEIGESYDWTGLEIMETYTDGSFRRETSLSRYEITGFDSSNAGLQTIYVSRYDNYGNYRTTSFYITVNAPISGELIYLIVARQPNKTVYGVGESYDWTGLEIIETYTDGSVRREINPASRYDITGFDSSSAGAKTIYVTGNGITTSFFVTIGDSDAYLLSLSMHSWPNKTVYEVGESAEWWGLEVRGYYSDNSVRSEVIDFYNDISGFDSSYEGTKYITVTKGGVSTGFTIYVNPRPTDAYLVSLYIYSLPYKQTYELYEMANWGGMEVRGYYSDGSERMEFVDSNNITGFDTWTSGTKYITFTKNGISAPQFTIYVNELIPAPDRYLQSLYIASLPIKQAYDRGESSDWSGLEVRGYYSDGSDEIVYDYDIWGFDTSYAGTIYITVNKNGINSPSFAITVRSLSSLHVSSQPYKTVYGLNESYDWTGLQIREYYTDGTERTGASYSDYNISGFDSSYSGSRTITVSKNDYYGNYYSTTFEITIRGLNSLTVYTQPYKLNYEMYESYDWTGLQITEYYSDGSERVETDFYTYEISGFDSSSYGEKTIYVSKSGINTNFTVMVEGLISLDISTPPTKLVYVQGDSADWTGLVVTENYFIRGAQIETNSDNYTISGFDSWTSGTQTITVTRSGVSATFTVEVLAAGYGSITIQNPSQPGEISLSVSGTTIIADSSYTGYQWFVDDMARPADSSYTDGRAITLSTSAYSLGIHRVRVTAYKQGIPYSMETTVNLQP
jgi:hypothetical protein